MATSAQFFLNFALTCSLWRLNVKETDLRSWCAMILSLYGGMPYESKYTVYPASENKQLPNANRTCNACRDL